jgi:bacteriorhodopsin
LIAATIGGNGLQQQQQQQLFFCAVDLSWFFIMGLFAWFLKSHRRRVGCSFQQQNPPANTKAFAKTLQILLRKNRPIYATASNNR